MTGVQTCALPICTERYEHPLLPQVPGHQSVQHHKAWQNRENRYQAQVCYRNFRGQRKRRYGKNDCPRLIILTFTLLIVVYSKAHRAVLETEPPGVLFQFMDRSSDFATVFARPLGRSIECPAVRAVPSSIRHRVNRRCGLVVFCSSFSIRCRK